MRHTTALATTLTLSLTALAVAPAAAQPVIDFREELRAERPEAWAMRWFAAALQPSGFGAADALAAGSVEIAAEMASLPRLSEAQRTVGFNGTKTEDLNRSPIYGRARADFGLGAGFVAGVGWIPPVELDGMRANLISVTLRRALFERGRFRLGAGLDYRTGTIEGDLTCDAATAAAGADPVRNPFGCEAPSDDEVRLDGWGFELTGSWRLGSSSQWRAHLAAAVHRLDSELRVDARYVGLIDRSVLAYDGTDWSATAGLSWRAVERLRLALDLVYSPLDVARDPLDPGTAENDPLVNLRVLAAWRVR